ncbi:heme-binding domain-containing protein [Spirosoma luteum]|uniref:heme-binding domain-containing protein n=1 Tax=Spirosoma luteum TaxID=431553 RepID=UPI000375CF84|nr:heme-binding domain-containing protein [Spirosoma luteum]
MRWLKIAAVATVVVLVGIQWIPTPLNRGDTRADKDFIALYAPPARTGTLLKTACYDCHSNHTDYPWYSRFQPVAMFLGNHIEEGKKDLNLSEFGDYSPRRQRSKLKAMSSQIEDGAMPLTSYRLIHWNANLSKADEKAVLGWLKSEIK